MNYIRIIIATLLANNLTGFLIRRLVNNTFSVKGAIINTDSKFITNTTCAHLFFRMYESSEIRFVLKYINPQTTILELGSSIGVIASVLSCNVQKLEFHCIEANLNLMETLKENLDKNVSGNYGLYNYAVVGNDNNSQLYFQTGNDSTTGHICHEKTDLIIPTITLSEFLATRKIKEYTLICDIEGAEVEILKNDSKALDLCQMVIIELHETSYSNSFYSIEKLSKIIIECGFKVVEKDGPNYVFIRK
ncbi:MAG: FkbM family methyltransferase [Fulvivirga sp.]|uniref:FkbM family methyltransferase n=1 Tax=Fulvivirga sp. TaxID=1931237 RepID=UPI0032F053F5